MLKELKKEIMSLKNDFKEFQDMIEFAPGQGSEFKKGEDHFYQMAEKQNEN